jgi:hypothetical protein
LHHVVCASSLPAEHRYPAENGTTANRPVGVAYSDLRNLLHIVIVDNGLNKLDWGVSGRCSLCWRGWSLRNPSGSSLARNWRKGGRSRSIVDRQPDCDRGDYRAFVNRLSGFYLSVQAARMMNVAFDSSDQVYQ